ncbi:uncharacterized protein BP5553_01624 [Venustampulla echinocandica]|uniref:Alpha/beta hydrolase fold-3 domain-containing protein n=1 Tax=Venustampulla echinocandica TaxID=2656787 RepID=A0A370U1K7_9HELO|nr:uncharacterized protein BP5553_01624 [Venustampulla echinocandica]RDL41645.1 hypothetical protein BP5553_01624 [Venustampulla echinocandica]
MDAMVKYQPGKGLWALGAVIVNAVQIPFWLLWYAFPSNRQHPQYSLRQAIATGALRNSIWHFCMINLSTPLVLKPKGKEKEFLVPIAPSSKSGVYGGICDDEHIKPTTVCGYWYPSPYIASEDRNKKVVLHFHGGAFVVGDCRPADSGYAAGLLTENIGKTLMVSYRLSSNPGGRFPAALQDAVSALHYLLDLGIDYSNIVVSGDSAGGNLVAALLRHLAGVDEPVLAAALLWSPWVDPATSVKPETILRSLHRWSDYIPGEFATWGGHAYCPKDGPISMEDGWISPRAHPFHTKTPIWVQGSGQEILFEEITEFAEGMKRVDGNNVAFHIEEIANHDILLLGNVTGFEKEAENAAKMAAEWLDRQ